MKNKKSFTEKEIVEIIEKHLPKIIERRPEIRLKIEEILEKKAATKDDIKAILLELARQREESNRRFEVIEKELARLREETNKRFEVLERDINKRFEEVNKRFEEVNRRFEDINRRFEDVNKRFEDMNKRFEFLERQMMEGFERMHKTISAIGARWGYGAEEAFRRGFEEVLSEIGYTVIKWRKMDDKAEYFLSRRPAEIDIVIKNKERIAIEVKSSLSFSEIEDFEKSIRFYEKEEKEKITKKIIVAIYPRKGREEYAKRFGISVIRGIEKAERYFEELAQSL